MLASFFFIFFLIWGVSLTYPMLASFLSGEFLLHIPCWFYFYAGNFSYTSHAAFIFCGGSFSDTSRAAFIFMRGVSLTHPKLPSFLCGELPSFLCGEFLLTSHAGFFLCGEFLLHIPIWLLFYVLHIPCLLFFMWGASFFCSLLLKESIKKRAR